MKNNELMHYGIPGMKWGHRKAAKLTKKAGIARESAKEWDEMSRYAAAKGKTKRADKYKRLAQQDRLDAKKYQEKAKIRNKEADFQKKQADIGKSRSMGHKIATNIIAGPFANRTYNSVLASGGSRTKAMGVTAAATLIGGPIGHIAVASIYRHDAGRGRKTF